MEIKDVADAIKTELDAKEKSFNSTIENVKADVEAKLEAKSNEVNTLKAEIKVIADRAEELDAKLAKAKESAKVEKKSFGESLLDSMKEVGGGDLNKGISEIEKSLKGANGTFTLNLKAVGDMTTSASLTGDPIRSYNSRQGLVPSQKINMRDLIPTVVSPTGTYVTYRETGSEGSISAQTEGSSKSQIDYDLTEVVTVNNYIAGFATFSKQLMKNLPFLDGTLTRMLLRDFYKAENSAFFTTVSGAATGSTTTTATNDVEQILELIANQMSANFNASYGLISPAQMARLQIATFGKGYYAGAGAVQLTQNSINIGGMNVLPASWVTDDKILIIDADYLERVEAESLSVTFSYENGTNFVQNKVTARVECQEAINTLRVDSLIYADLGNVS